MVDYRCCSGAFLVSFFRCSSPSSATRLTKRASNFSAYSFSSALCNTLLVILLLVMHLHNLQHMFLRWFVLRHCDSEVTTSDVNSTNTRPEKNNGGSREGENSGKKTKAEAIVSTEENREVPAMGTDCEDFPNGEGFVCVLREETDVRDYILNWASGNILMTSC
jgi:hypothetical protein